MNAKYMEDFPTFHVVCACTIFDEIPHSQGHNAFCLENLQ